MGDGPTPLVRGVGIAARLHLGDDLVLQPVLANGRVRPAVHERRDGQEEPERHQHDGHDAAGARHASEYGARPGSPHAETAGLRRPYEDDGRAWNE